MWVHWKRKGRRRGDSSAVEKPRHLSATREERKGKQETHFNMIDIWRPVRSKASLRVVAAENIVNKIKTVKPLGQTRSSYTSSMVRQWFVITICSSEFSSLECRWPDDILYIYILTARRLGKFCTGNRFLGFQNFEDVGPFNETWPVLQGPARGHVAGADVISHHRLPQTTPNLPDNVCLLFFGNA